MPTQPRPIEVELRPELTTKVSCLLLGRSHIVSFFEILSRFYVRKWIKSSKELRLCQLFYWYSSQMQAKPSRKIELVNKAYLFWYWQRFKKNSLGIKLFCFQDRKLKLFESVWKRISWNPTKFQLDQTIDRKNENNNLRNKLNELRFCEVLWNYFSNRCWKIQLSKLKKYISKKYES